MFGKLFCKNSRNSCPISPRNFNLSGALFPSISRALCVPDQNSTQEEEIVPMRNLDCSMELLSGTMDLSIQFNAAPGMFGDFQAIPVVPKYEWPAATTGAEDNPVISDFGSAKRKTRARKPRWDRDNLQLTENGVVHQLKSHGTNQNRLLDAFQQARWTTRWLGNPFLLEEGTRRPGARLREAVHRLNRLKDSTLHFRIKGRKVRWEYVGGPPCAGGAGASPHR